MRVAPSGGMELGRSGGASVTVLSAAAVHYLR